MTIEQRPLGRTGAEVTILGYGAMELRGVPRGPAIDDEDAGRLLNEVLDSGINLIDTSIDYGKSEELIGRYISGRRDEYFLASKCGCLAGDVPQAPPAAAGERPRQPHDFSPENVRAGVEQSLRRLKTDHLDLVQVHISPSREELEKNGTIETMTALRDEGKVRFLGMSGTLPHLPDHIAMDVFDVFQIPYSVIQREHEELISDAVRAGAGTLIRGGAARGAPAPDKDWSRAPIGLREGEGERRWTEAEIDDLLAGMSPIEFVLRFTLTHPGLSSTIVGTSSLDHLRSNVAIAEKGVLPDDVYAAPSSASRFPGLRKGLTRYALAMALEETLRNEEYLHIPYVLMVWSTPGPGEDWVCHAEYPELPGCAVEHANALRAIEELDAMKDDFILERLARGEDVPVPRPPLRA